MATALREVLGSFTTPERTERVLEAALAGAGLEHVPETPHEAAAFVSGPFRRAIVRLVSEDTADAVVEGLRPVVDLASGFHSVPEGIRRTVTNPPPEPDPSALAPPKSPSLEFDLPIPTEPVGLPVVLVATLDRAGVDVVADKLRGRADVRIVADAFEWTASLKAYSGRRLVVVLDCCLPSVDPLAAGAMAPMLPEHTDVVVWGASSGLLGELVVTVGDASNWHHLPVDATPVRLAEFLASGV